MKKLLILMLITTFLFSACAAETLTPVAPTAVVLVTPDASMATPAVGSATVKKLAGPQALSLRSRPDLKSAAAGTVLPGTSGKLIGLDASGTWFLLEFKEQSGWAPIEMLDFTIAQ